MCRDPTVAKRDRLTVDAKEKRTGPGDMPRAHHQKEALYPECAERPLRQDFTDGDWAVAFHVSNQGPHSRRRSKFPGIRDRRHTASPSSRRRERTAEKENVFGIVPPNGWPR